jgi:phage shock protein A
MGWGVQPGSYERECTAEIIHKYEEMAAQQQTRIDTLEKLAEHYQALVDNQEALIKELNEKPARLHQYLDSITAALTTASQDLGQTEAQRASAQCGAESAG